MDIALQQKLNNQNGGIEIMIYALAIQKIKDYDKWKEVFDEHGKVRMIKGSKK